TILSFNSNKVIALDSLSDDEFLLYQAFEQQPILRFDEVQKILNKKNVFNVIDDLLKKDIINLNQHVYEKYKPKLVKYVGLHEDFNDQQQLKHLLENDLKTEKQRTLVLKYFQLKLTNDLITLHELLEETGVSKAIFSNLEKKQIFKTYTIAQDRIQFSDAVRQNIQFTEIQQKTLHSINEQFVKNDVILLNAVTGSGKTELYINLIEEIIQQKKQVLFLAPEIGLTTQLVLRLTAYFGNKVSVYNSKYSDNERVEVYNNVLKHKETAQVVIGSRSSIFLPFAYLGLIIVDEEHEQSYKQHDPAPRFHARDAAVVLSKIHQAKILLGTATPSLESYYNVYQEKYGYVELLQRYNNALLPEIVLVDMKQAYKR